MGVNNIIDGGMDGVQYAGADNWNEYVAELDFGISNPAETGKTYIYIRQDDDTHYLRVAYDPTAKTLQMQKNTGGGATNIGSAVPYIMNDPVNSGGHKNSGLR